MSDSDRPAPLIQARILPVEELARAIAAGGPLAEIGATPDRIAQMSVVVVEVDGTIVAYWIAWYGLHLEPLWIREDHRHHAQVGRALLDQMGQLLELAGERSAFCCLEDANRGVLERAAGRLGFVPSGATLYYAVLQPAEPPVEG